MVLKGTALDIAVPGRATITKSKKKHQECFVPGRHLSFLLSLFPNKARHYQCGSDRHWEDIVSSIQNKFYLEASLKPASQPKLVQMAETKEPVEQTSGKVEDKPEENLPPILRLFIKVVGTYVQFNFILNYYFLSWSHYHLKHV